MEYKQADFLIMHMLQLRRTNIERQFIGKDLYFGQLPILTYIYKHSNCRQKDIAEFLASSNANIAKSIMRMIKKGLLKRKVDIKDNRQYNLTITEKGLEVINQQREIIDGVDKISFAGFSKEEFQQYCRLLERIVSNLQEGKPDE